MPMTMKIGYWGPPTSSVNWCETDYAFTEYIAEFFNTVSSFTMFLGGLLGLILHSSSLDTKFKVGFVALMVVGLGSAAFHATLLFHLQMLDEIPMLWDALVVAYCLLTPPGTRSPAFKRYLSLGLFLHGLLVSFLVSSNNPYQFYVFHVSFGTIELFCLFKIFRLYFACDRPRAKALYGAGLSIYLFAIFCWFLDLHYCFFFNEVLPNELGVPNPQLHSWWHVLVTMGLYLNTVMVIEDQAHLAGRKPSVMYAWGVPYVKYDHGKEL